jgi:hypothetical protein
MNDISKFKVDYQVQVPCTMYVAHIILYISLLCRQSIISFLCSRSTSTSHHAGRNLRLWWWWRHHACLGTLHLCRTRRMQYVIGIQIWYLCKNYVRNLVPDSNAEVLSHEQNLKTWKFWRTFRAWRQKTLAPILNFHTPWTNEPTQIHTMASMTQATATGITVTRHSSRKEKGSY